MVNNVNVNYFFLKTKYVSITDGSPVNSSSSKHHKNLLQIPWFRSQTYTQTSVCLASAIVICEYSTTVFTIFNIWSTRGMINTNKIHLLQVGINTRKQTLKAKCWKVTAELHNMLSCKPEVTGLIDWCGGGGEKDADKILREKVLFCC